MVWGQSAAGEIFFACLIAQIHSTEQHYFHLVYWVTSVRYFLEVLHNLVINDVVR